MDHSDHSHEFWLAAVAACFAIGAVMLGGSFVIVAAKPSSSHAHWTTIWEAFVAYAVFAVGVLSFIAAIRGAAFPLTGQSLRAVIPPTTAETPGTPALIRDIEPDTRAVYREVEWLAEPLATAPADRVFVHRTPRELVGLFERETAILAQKQADPFYGKWIKVSGRLDDVGAWSGFATQVTVYFKREGLSPRFPVFMMFRDKEYVENKLTVLKAGDMITVQGEIERIDSVSMQLTSCELVDAPGEAQQTGSPAPRGIPALQPPIFDQAPPELANVSAASLNASFAGRTQAQGDKLMEQHVGKPVCVSGEVDQVTLGHSVPTVTLNSTPRVLLFFDPDDDYDPVPIALALNEGDEVVVSGQVHQLLADMVALDHCKLIEARGRAA